MFKQLMQPGQTITHLVNAEWALVRTGFVEVKPDNYSGQRMNARDYWKAPTGFKQVAITCRSEVATEVHIDFGLGDYKPATMIEDASTVEVVNTVDVSLANAVALAAGQKVAINTPATFVGFDDVLLGAGQSTVLLPASTTRKEVIIQAEADSVNCLRIGGANVSATRGLKLYTFSGGVNSVTLSTQAAVKVHNAGTAAVTISGVEVRE